jgi:uracil-DNA glycosylase
MPNDSSLLVVLPLVHKRDNFLKKKSTRLKLLTEEVKKPYFLQLKRMLKNEGVQDADHRSTSIFPAGALFKFDMYQRVIDHCTAKDIYAWSNSPLGRVRVVIIGQDPYHNVGQAHGKLLEGLLLRSC